MPQHHNSPKIL